jgi:hypothetical protein
MEKSKANSTESSSRISVFSELLSFLWKKKQWWLIPIVIALVLLGILIGFAQNSAIGPLMYTVF